MSDDREVKLAVLKKEFLTANNYNMPTSCPKCGGVMIFKGVGEYKCEDCGYKDYDDYGKVRNYLEKHAGATAAEAERETGVSQKSIREMLKESRLEIALNSSTFMRCEMCGVDIRSGRFCPKCEVNYHRKLEEQIRNGRNIDLSGFSTEKQLSDDGFKRFIREK